MLYRAMVRRWDDGQVVEVEATSQELSMLKGDVLKLHRLQGKKVDRSPDPRVVAARAFGQARKL